METPKNSSPTLRSRARQQQQLFGESMPCAAGILCLKPDHTPGPPHFTNHKCRVCSGYLHGTCGLQDPLGESEMQRVCEPCVNSTTRKASSPPDADLQASKRHCEEEQQGNGKGKRKAAVDEEPATRKKAGGAATRVRLSYERKAYALGLLETMTLNEVASKLGVGVSSIHKWKRAADSIRKKAESPTSSKKSSKGADFPEVGYA